MSEHETLLEQVLAFFKEDENVRAAILNGSRANPGAPKDFLRDYDIALYVQSLQKARRYKEDMAWVKRFGEVAIIQQNDFEKGSFVVMTQYMDISRTDVSFHDIANIQKNIRADSLSLLLFDRDGAAGALPPAGEASYFVQKPDRARWDATLNELWWIQCYVAKALCRREWPWCKTLFNEYLMEPLTRLLSWQVGQAHGWQVNVGKHGAWLKRYLPPEQLAAFTGLYCAAQEEAQWQALFRAGELVRAVGLPLAQKLGYTYPLEDDRRVSLLLPAIRAAGQAKGM